MYSTDSELTKGLCSAMGFCFSVNFVKTMKRNGKIFVSGTVGKPNAWDALRAAVTKLANFNGCELIYKGR